MSLNMQEDLVLFYLLKKNYIASPFEVFHHTTQKDIHAKS